jgi:hypothetical protein
MTISEQIKMFIKIALLHYIIKAISKCIKKKYRHSNTPNLEYQSSEYQDILTPWALMF